MLQLRMVQSLDRVLLQKSTSKILQIFGDLSVKDKLSVVLSLVDHLEYDSAERVKITLFLQLIHSLRKHLPLCLVIKIDELDDFGSSCACNKGKGKIIDSRIAFDERAVEVDEFYAFASDHEVGAAEVAMKNFVLSQGLKAFEDLQASSDNFWLIHLVIGNIFFESVMRAIFQDKANCPPIALRLIQKVSEEGFPATVLAIFQQYLIQLDDAGASSHSLQSNYLSLHLCHILVLKRHLLDGLVGDYNSRRSYGDDLESKNLACCYLCFVRS